MNMEEHNWKRKEKITEKKEGEGQTIVMGGEKREWEGVGSHFLVHFLKHQLRKELFLLRHFSSICVWVCPGEL